MLDSDPPWLERASLPGGSGQDVGPDMGGGVGEHLAKASTSSPPPGAF